MHMRLLNCVDGRAVVAEDRFGRFAEFTVNCVPFRFRWVSPQAFFMGCQPDELSLFGDPAREGPLHKVTLTKGFWIGETQVTQRQWGALMKMDGSRFWNPDLPAASVTWHRAVEFCDLFPTSGGGVEVRLPTEAEWECACRAGTVTQFSNGASCRGRVLNAPEIDDVAVYVGNSRGAWEAEATPKPVKSKTPNGWGLYAMHGNVYEWCMDGPRLYSSEAVVDPIGPRELGNFALRGGGYLSSAARCRSGARHAYDPNFGPPDFGFRIVLAEPPSRPSE